MVLLICKRFMSSAFSAGKNVFKTKKIVLATPYDGEAKESNFKLVEEDIQPLKDGEILCQAEWLSVDPYMRAYAAQMKIGNTIFGHQVGRIIESKNPAFPVGKYVVGNYGWRTHTKINPEDYPPSVYGTYLLPDIGSHPASVGIGTAGMTGATAYFGFLNLCYPKQGDVVLVSTAAGAVGSVVGQIAKIKGCTVIGFTGSDEKVAWLKDIGFDYAYNYKTANLKRAFKEAAPEGVDCYFDNVGGTFSSFVLSRMSNYGRIAVCGAVSQYNATTADQVVKVPASQGFFVSRQLKMEGFVIQRWNDTYMEAISQLAQWVKEDKLKYKETVYDGFENMPKALISLMKGENIGKAIVKA